jgi:hypothetical protein
MLTPDGPCGPACQTILRQAFNCARTLRPEGERYSIFRGPIRAIDKILHLKANFGTAKQSRPQRGEADRGFVMLVRQIFAT